MTFVSSYVELLFGNIVRTLKGVLHDVSSIVNKRELISAPGYAAFQSTVCQLLMELLVLVQDAEGTFPSPCGSSTNSMDAFSAMGYPPFFSTGLPLYPAISTSSNQFPFQIPLLPPPGLTQPLPPIPSIPILGQPSSSANVFSFPPPGLQPVETAIPPFRYFNGSDAEASDKSERQVTAPAFEYLEIDFPSTESRKAPTTPKRVTSLPGSPTSSQLRAPFSPNKWVTGSTVDLDTSKAKLEAKYKEAEKRRNSLLKTRNTRLKKELDEVITKTAQVRKQLEEENALLQTQFTERQTRAQVLRESQLLAVQEAAKNSIQRVTLASQRRAQYAEQTMKSLKARYELIHNRREEFNKRIKEKALSSTTRYKENMKESTRDSKDSSPQLLSGSLTVQGSELVYKQVDTVWPPSINYGIHGAASTEHTNGKISASIHSLSEATALTESIELHETLTLQWIALQQLAMVAIRNVSRFYTDTAFPLREYTSKVVIRAEKILVGAPVQAQEEATRDRATTSEPIDKQAWVQYLLSWPGSRYKLKDANNAESIFSDTIAIIGHDHSEIHTYTYAVMLSIAALTTNYLHKCVAAAQEIIPLLERGGYSTDEISLLIDASTLALFLASTYLRFSAIFLPQCHEHPELKSIYTATSVPLTNITRYLNKTPGVCKEALVYSFLSVALKMVHLTANVRAAAILDAFFKDRFIVDGVWARISIPIIPSESFLTRSDACCTELAIVHDNFSAVQQALRIAIDSFLLYDQEGFNSYFGPGLSCLCKAAISCLSQLLLSSTSFASHSKERKHFRLRSFARHITDNIDMGDLTSSQLFSRHQRGVEDHVLSVDLQSIVAECFTLLAHLVTKFPTVFIDALSRDEVVLLEMSHSLSVLPLPGALFADEPSLYVNMQTPYCICFPRYYIVSADEGMASKPNSYGVGTTYCTKSKEPTLMLSALRITGSPQVIFQANVYPFEAVVHDCMYTSLSPALLCGLVFMRNALQLKHKVVRQLVSFGNEPVVLLSVISSLPVECFIDGFLRKRILDPIFRAAREYGSLLSSDLPDDLLANDLPEDQTPIVSEMLLPVLRLT
ncbi:hypothetical protein GL50803_006332 [Giardia duodenalis]|uniref:Uncharacterized protein n=1 Tax=Giardia intestinalis (strain ATCC 50803 / WB clone C6) TaxID=184922 RepID=A8BLW7_GIAIC|nr:hypothetical protein GL50803_006332 [Giardia intestinalis]KAE8302271.1 hypothetical protein GL50803_006332 [Giardia intestinalis]|eukprot:XP_001706195.1 Hypothetical protein GL50803_6332 [Giardia lamblia ATCC 50803]